MEQIAGEAGVTKAVLYDHFSGKEGLRQAVLDDYGDELLATLGSGVQTDRTPAQLLHDSVTAFAAFVERDTELFRFVTHGEQTLLTESSPVFAALIRNTIEAAGGDPSGAAVYADVVLGGVFAAVDAWVRAPEMTRQTLVEHITTVLWHGLRAGVEGALDDAVDMAPALEALDQLGALPPPGSPPPD